MDKERKMLKGDDVVVSAAVRAMSISAGAMESNDQDELCVMEGLISTHRAVDMRGAVAQVMLALADARTIGGGGDIDSGVRRIERCLYSAMAIMERDGGVDRRELGGDYWMTDVTSPWQ